MLQTVFARTYAATAFPNRLQQADPTRQATQLLRYNPPPSARSASYVQNSAHLLVPRQPFALPTRETTPRVLRYHRIIIQRVALTARKQHTWRAAHRYLTLCGLDCHCAERAQRATQPRSVSSLSPYRQTSAHTARMHSRCVFLLRTIAALPAALASMPTMRICLPSGRHCIHISTTFVTSGANLDFAYDWRGLATPHNGEGYGLAANLPTVHGTTIAVFARNHPKAYIPYCATNA